MRIVVDNQPIQLNANVSSQAHHHHLTHAYGHGLEVIFQAAALPSAAQVLTPFEKSCTLSPLRPPSRELYRSDPKPSRATARMAAQYFFDAMYSLANCLVCFPSAPQLRINSRSFRMLRLLGEVGFNAPMTHLFFVVPLPDCFLDICTYIYTLRGDKAP